jgi:hypothetical protein
MIMPASPDDPVGYRLFSPQSCILSGSDSFPWSRADDDKGAPYRVARASHLFQSPSDAGPRGEAQQPPPSSLPRGKRPRIASGIQRLRKHTGTAPDFVALLTGPGLSFRAGYGVGALLEGHELRQDRILPSSGRVPLPSCARSSRPPVRPVAIPVVSRAPGPRTSKHDPVGSPASTSGSPTG